MVLDKVVYSVPEASALLRRPHSYFLGEAVEGRMALYIRIQDHVVTPFSMDSIQWQVPYWTPRDKSYYPYPPFRLSTLKHLLLSQESCEALLNNGMAEQTSFSEGIYFDKSGDVEIIRSDELKTPTSSKYVGFGLEPARMPLENRSYVLYPIDFLPHEASPAALNNPLSIEATVDSVFITRPTLAALLRDVSETAINPATHLPLPEHDYISDNLRSLHKFLFELLKGADEHYTWPAARALAFELCESYGFSQNQANAGAKILRLSTLSRTESGDLKLDAIGVQALIDCAREFWSTSTANSATYPKKPEMMDWLADRLDLLDKAAEACLALISPNFASKSGRRTTY